MSTWKIIQSYQQSRIELLKGQAVILATNDGFGIYARTLKGEMLEAKSTFLKDDLESIRKSFNSIHELAKAAGCVLLSEDPVLHRAKSWAVERVMSSFEEADWIWDYLVAVCKEPTGQKNFRCSFANPSEAHERDDGFDIQEALIGEKDSLMLFWESSRETVLFMACEFDDYRSNNSRVIHGIFSTKEKAVNALTSLYGELRNDSDGGELGFVPVNNVHDVRLQVLKASIDEVSEI